MDAASQNSTFLLAGLISGQGAGLSVGGVSQATDNSTEFGGASFLASLDQSNQALQFEPESPVMALDMDGLLEALNQLLAGQAATTGTGLPLLEGQEFAADMSNEDLLSVISQLQGEGVEELVTQLASMLQVQAGATESIVSAQPSKQQVDEVFAQIRQLLENTVSSQTSLRQQPEKSMTSEALLQQSQTIVLNSEVVDQSAEQSKLAERRLVERLNAILPQPAQAVEAANVGENLKQSFTGPELASAVARQAQESSDSFSNMQMTRDSFNNAVLSQSPILIDRMAAAMANERQISADLSNWKESDSSQTPVPILDPGKTVSGGSRSAAAAMPTIIQTPLTAPQWQSEFSDKVMMMSRVAATQGQNQVAEIRLNPAHLGPIEVRVSMKDDLASITFSAQHGVVRDAIESSLPRLREMFNNSGIMLADANVSEHSLQNRQQQNQQSDSNAQYGHAEEGLGLNEQNEFISQINLSAMSSPDSLDLYA